MKTIYRFTLAVALVFVIIPSTFAQTPSAQMSDEEVRAQIVQESRANYSGSCPCPYNRDRAGRWCGGRSAYSRPGGASPMCYPSDVSDTQVQRWRVRHQ